MIRINSINKTYTMGEIALQVLKDVSISIDEGEYVAVVGPSGSGKSTLMNILGCLDLPDDGSYYLDNKEISEYTEDQLSAIRNEKIGFVFQSFNLLPKLTALENVELPLIYRGLSPKERREKATKVLESVGLKERLHHKPSELSGGQQQRVAIARALAGDPPFILADEPTGNLDSKSGHDVMDMLDQMNKDGKTIVLITHEQDIAIRASRVITIRDGVLTEKGMN